MNTRYIIRQLLAGFLLILFAFSITPRQTLHDWLANHVDREHPHCSYGDVTHYGVYGFHCDTDNLVAESPFTHQVVLFEFRQPAVFAARPGFAPHHYYAATHFFFSLRGPPAVSSL